MLKKFSTPKIISGGNSTNSTGNYENFNLATHTGDDLTLVEKNRQLLIEKYNLPQAPRWLEQTHSNICIDDNDVSNFGDSIITRKRGVVCCVLTADCLPVFAWVNNNITQTPEIVGVAHAGWQGIFNGVIEKFIANFLTNNIDAKDIHIEFGVALGQDNFEVGVDFYQHFVDKNQKFKDCFISFKDKYKFDIYKSCEIILKELGVQHITKNTSDTFIDDNCFSYRRDGKNSGRNAHCIYMQ